MDPAEPTRAATPEGTVTIAAEEAELRLDRWFRRHFPTVSQGMIQKFCRTGQIRLDGRRVEAATRISPGQVVRIPPLPAPGQAGTRPAPKPPAPATNPEHAALAHSLVLYRDESVLVLDKPFDLPSQGGPGISRHLDLLLGYLQFDRTDRPRLVHRLDRETTGVIVVARSARIAAKLAQSFRGREVEKTYWAIVAGRPVPVAGRVAQDLVREAGPHGAHVRAAEPGTEDAAHAITDYRTLDHAGRRLAWLELQPLTGRTHQLRVHCAELGAPILGDAKYGTVRNTDSRGWRNTAVVSGDGLAAGLHLHARRITLPHPEGGRLTVEAPLPPHMRTSFASLGFTEPPVAPARRER